MCDIGTHMSWKNTTPVLKPKLQKKLVALRGHKAQYLLCGLLKAFSQQRKDGIICREFVDVPVNSKDTTGRDKLAL